MSNEFETGGSAFPVPDIDGGAVCEGMTLRDYFAAKAMQGFQEQWVYDNSDDIACKAYALADAMLKARQK